MELLPEPEAVGLLALMLLQESRRQARTSAEGQLVLLDDQDRSQWNQGMIAEGRALVEEAFKSRRFGPYTLQAAIAAMHVEAACAPATDWGEIVGLYDVLLRADPSPVVELNRAAAVAMRDGSAAGIALIDAILGRGELNDYPLAHSARAELCRRQGRRADALQSYERALSLTHQGPQRRFMERRLQELRAAATAILLVLGACGDNRKDVTAPPEPGSFTITVAAEGSGAGRVTTAAGQEPAISCDVAGAETPAGVCTATYLEGTVVALTMTPESSSVFAGWAGDAGTCGTTLTCSLTITANHSVIARLSATTPTPTPDGTAEVVSAAFYPQPSFGTEGAVIWVVEVRNTSSQVVESARIDFTTHDTAGEILATNAAFVGPIPPGETRVGQSSAAYVGTEASAQFETVDVQFGTGETNLSSAEIVTSTWRVDPASGPEGAVVWTVEVRNTTSSSLGSTEIEFSTFDAAGGIVAAAFTFVDDIPPGETRSAEGFADYHGTEASARFQVAGVD